MLLLVACAFETFPTLRDGLKSQDFSMYGKKDDTVKNTSFVAPNGCIPGKTNKQSIITANVRVWYVYAESTKFFNA